MFGYNSMDSQQRQPTYHPSKRRLSGKIAMITGAGTPSGRAAALLFAYEGADIIAIDPSGESAESIAAEIHLEGRNARAYHLDSTPSKSIISIVEDAVSAWGPVDILYNAAAPIASSYEFAARNDNRTCPPSKPDPNLILHFCRAVMPGMREARAGSIINTSAISHTWQFQDDGITALSRILALANQAFNIRVNALTPIGVASQHAWDLARSDTSLCQIKHTRRRLGIVDPNEIAKAALYLATSSLTGKTFLITQPYSA